MAGIQGFLSRTIGWGSNKQRASAPAPASPELTAAFQDLFGTAGYRVSAEGNAAPPNATEALNILRQGKPLSVSLPDSNFSWPVDSADRLAEFVFGESGQTQNLPEATQRQFALLAKLKRGGVKFYSKRDNNTAMGVKAAPLWQLGKGSLWASRNGGAREKVDSLEQYARSLNIDPNVVLPTPVAADAAAPQAADTAAAAVAPPAGPQGAEVAAPAVAAAPAPVVADASPAVAAAPASVVADAAPVAAAPLPAVFAAQPPVVPAAQAPVVPAAQAPVVPAAQPPVVPAAQAAVVPAAQAPVVPAAQPPVVPAAQAAVVPAAQPSAAAASVAAPVVLLATPDTAPIQVVSLGDLAPAAAPPDQGIIAGPAFGISAAAPAVAAAAPVVSAPVVVAAAPVAAAAAPAVASGPAVTAAPAPPAAAATPPAEEAPPNLFADAIIAPSALPVAAPVAKVKKEKEGGPVVTKEMLFILPPGQKRLMRMPVAPSKMLTSTLVRNGVSFIYMNVMATSKGRLDNFLKQHPMISKLLESSGTAMPAQMGVSRSSGVAREKVREFLVALPGDFDGDTCTFTPNLEMATGLALSEVPVAYIRLSGTSTSSLDMLNNFVRTKTLAESNH